MKSVFLGGSRRVTRLNTVIRERLDQIMQRELTVYIGDANGADRAMQRHFADAHYSNVVVYAVASHLRNNLGSWRVELVTPPENSTGYEMFAAKDLLMAERAGAGLMLWDGKSRGTLENIRNLIAHEKPVALYFAPRHRFINLRASVDLARLFPAIAPNAVARISSPTELEEEQHPLFFD
jgi:hypothetical protein